MIQSNLLQLQAPLKIYNPISLANIKPHFLHCGREKMLLPSSEGEIKLKVCAAQSEKIISLDQID